MNQRTTLLITFILGALGVAIGAFGAHWLKDLLIENGRIDTFKTGVFYHLLHTLALFGTGLIMEKDQGPTIRYASFAFILGIVFFSFSLYMLSITNVKILGAITPIGGVFFIGGWLLLFIAIKNSPNFKSDH